MTFAEAVAPIGELIVQPTPESIRTQLARIQASADFDAPDRVRKFLQFVIEETLAGRAERIKAFSIALEVFGRDASFDAQADPVVRIEAGRLRRGLEHYYLTTGKSDPILITIPKRSYIPSFELRDSNEELSRDAATALPIFPNVQWRQFPRWQISSAILVLSLVTIVSVAWNFIDRYAAVQNSIIDISQPDIPKLLIGPFEDLTGSESSAILTRGLTAEVVGQIAKFRDLRVVEIPAVSSKVDAQLNPAALARYELLGSVTIAKDTLRLTARLRKLDDGSILWAQSYDADLAVQGVLAVQAQIAREVTTALAQPYGVIFQADSTRPTQSPPNDWEAYSCTLSYYTYRHSMDWGDHARVQECLERTVERFPGYASAWALLSIIYLDDFRFRFPKTAPPPLDRAFEAAKRASDLDPRNARAQQALMMALFFRQEVTAALKVGAEAVAYNPNDTELLAEYGVQLSQSGEWEQGRAIITRALSQNPIPPTYYDLDFAVNFYMVRDYPAAKVWVEKTRFGTNPIYHLTAAAIYGQLGRAVEAKRERDWLLSNAPDLIENIRTDLVNRLGRPEDRAHAIEGLVLAGLPIPPERNEVGQ